MIAASSERLRKVGTPEAGYWLTARGGDPTDSATENIPPMEYRAIDIYR